MPRTTTIILAAPDAAEEVRCRDLLLTGPGQAVPAIVRHTATLERALEVAGGFSGSVVVASTDDPAASAESVRAARSRGLNAPVLLIGARPDDVRGLAGTVAVARDCPSGECRVVVARLCRRAERRSARQSLRRCERNLRAVVDASQDGLIVVGRRDGLVLFANPAAERLLGRPAMELVGRPLGHELVPGRADEVEMAGGPASDPVVVELRVAETEWQGTPALLATLRDVTERKLAEQQARALSAELEQRIRDRTAELLAKSAELDRANRTKDQFLAALSHELRTPLAPVLMTVTSIGADPSLPTGVRRDLEVIRRNVELEARLIDDLLDLTRMTQGRLELKRAPVDLHAVVRQMADGCCSTDVRQKRLKVDLDLTARDRWVSGDEARLTQVVWHVLKNAVKFTPAGGRVSVRTANDLSGRVVLEVADSGIGIEPAAQGRVFDAFEQQDRAIARQFGGLGLGLAVSRRLVELHGGTISVYSAGRDRGTTFTVGLPTCPPPPATATSTTLDQSIAGRHARTGAFAGTEATILLVEDHEETREVVGRLLRAMGYRVIPAGNVADALRLADERPVDLVLSDLGLPDGTGTDLMRQLRDRHGLSGIALSGFGMEEDRRRSRLAGFADHLVKPVSLERLEAAIDQVMGVADRRAEGARH
ncbi:MAG TPA: ATP-binding protein [Humisphaera sp.]